MLVLHSNFQYQQYQEILIQSQLLQFTEGLVTADALLASGFTPTVFGSVTDSGIVQDSMVQSAVLKLTESLVVSEASSVTQQVPTTPENLGQDSVVQDSLMSTITLKFTESLVSQDTVTPTAQTVTHLPPWPAIGPYVWRSGQKPFHSDQHSLEVSAQHTSFYTPGTDDSFAYQSIGALGSSLKPQGYQAITSIPGSSVLIAATEFALALDSQTQTIKLSGQELAVAGDFLSTDPTVRSENEPLSELVTLNILLSFEELALVSELGTGVEADLSSQISETIAGIKIQTSAPVQQDAGTKIRTGIGVDAPYGIAVTTNIPSLVPVTNATSVANPFTPTLVVQGTTIFQGAGNPPPTNVANSNVFFTYRSAGLSGLSLCNLYNFGFTLDYGGGHWEATSNIPMASGNPATPDDAAKAILGKQVQFFGLNASITQSGRVLNNGAKGYSASGIFGSLILHRQINYILYGNQTFNPLLLNPNYKVPNATQYSTVFGAAAALITQVNALSTVQGIDNGRVQLIWNANDAPYNSTLQEAGGTGLDALQGLASRIGATLRWDGNNTYRVAYPDRFYGTWTVPDCHLIAAGGIEYTNYYDLETGLSALGSFMFPGILALTSKGQNQLPGSTSISGSSPAVTQIAKLTKKLGATDPPLVYDLPQDYDQVFVQVLVAAAQPLGGVNLISPISWVTRDPTQWFEYAVGNGVTGGLSSNTEIVYRTDIGGVQIPQVQVDFRAMPQGNSAVDANKFVLSIAATRRAVPNQAPVQDALAKDLESQQMKFIKIKSGRISCMFFGSIPLPGMWGKATVGDLTVEGIIENVQFTNPGFVTVDVAQYLRLTFIGGIGTIVGNDPFESSIYEINPRGLGPLF